MRVRRYLAIWRKYISIKGEYTVFYLINMYTSLSSYVKFKTIHLYCLFVEYKLTIVQYELKDVLVEQLVIAWKVERFREDSFEIIIYPSLMNHPNHPI